MNGGPPLTTEVSELTGYTGDPPPRRVSPSSLPGKGAPRCELALMGDRQDIDLHHVVAGLLVEAGLVLLCHRSANRRWYPNVWDLPGGHVEKGETPANTLVRELHESSESRFLSQPTLRSLTCGDRTSIAVFGSSENGSGRLTLRPKNTMTSGGGLRVGSATYL
jgi:hypothetical protein